MLKDKLGYERKRHQEKEDWLIYLLHLFDLICLISSHLDTQDYISF